MACRLYILAKLVASELSDPRKNSGLVRSEIRVHYARASRPLSSTFASKTRQETPLSEPGSSRKPNAYLFAKARVYRGVVDFLAMALAKSVGTNPEYLAMERRQRTPCGYPRSARIQSQRFEALDATPAPPPPIRRRLFARGENSRCTQQLFARQYSQ